MFGERDYPSQLDRANLVLIKIFKTEKDIKMLFILNFKKPFLEFLNKNRYQIVWTSFLKNRYQGYNKCFLNSYFLKKMVLEKQFELAS